MIPSQVILAVLGCIDGALLVLSYLIHRRIRALSRQFDLLSGSS